MNSITDKSLRHMAWANEQMLNIIIELPDDAINFSSWNTDWTIGKIVNHIVDSQGSLNARITGQPSPEKVPEAATAAGISDLILIFKERDAHILSIASAPDQIRTIERNGNKVEFLTSTVIAQSVHHATEHRVQISDILATNKMDVLNLDELSFFRFEKWLASNK